MPDEDRGWLRLDLLEGLLVPAVVMLLSVLMLARNEQLQLVHLQHFQELLVLGRVPLPMQILIRVRLLMVRLEVMLERVFLQIDALSLFVRLVEVVLQVRAQVLVNVDLLILDLEMVSELFCNFTLGLCLSVLIKYLILEELGGSF